MSIPILDIGSAVSSSMSATGDWDYEIVMSWLLNKLLYKYKYILESIIIAYSKFFLDLIVLYKWHL